MTYEGVEIEYSLGWYSSSDSRFLEENRNVYIYKFNYNSRSVTR